MISAASESENAGVPAAPPANGASRVTLLRYLAGRSSYSLNWPVASRR